MEKRKDIFGTKFGMWLFIFSEIMLFAGLFVLYAAYFVQYKADFVEGGKELNIIFGTVNTVILLTSSFFVAASVTAVRRKTNKTAIMFLGLALLLGALFLTNKYFEWGHKFEAGIYPNSPVLVDGPPGRNIFFVLYYVITGLHGLHIMVGMLLLGISALLVWKKRVHAGNYAILDNAGLYWHLVDVIWIFIFPLFYLIL